MRHLGQSGDVVLGVLDVAGLVLGPQRERERRRHSERGRATHTQRLDREAHALGDVAHENVSLEREPGLVDQKDRGPAGGLVFAPPDGAWDVVDA